MKSSIKVIEYDYRGGEHKMKVSLTKLRRDILNYFLLHFQFHRIYV